MTSPSANSALPDATRLAIDRTRLAFERTMMAWVRTAASMITFGFTVYKFFELDGSRVARTSNPLIGTREFALLLIVVGLASLVLATLQHRHNLQTLRARYRDTPIPTSQAGTLALMMSALGLTALLAVIFRQ
jgi:inner membrane protein YidH